MRGSLSGFPLKFVAVSVRKSKHFLIARPEFKDLRDLKGKRLAVSTLFGNKKEVVPFMLRFLDQSQDVAERSYELLVASLSRNGEITDQEWEILTERKRPLEEVRDFTLCGRRDRN